MTDHQMDKARFGGFLAEERKRLGLTQKELARRLYISDKAVSKWERGLSLPDVSLLIPLADTLGVTVTELLEGRRIRPAEGMEMGEVEQVVKKALAFTGGPGAVGLLPLALLDLCLELWLFSCSLGPLYLPYAYLALPVRLLFLGLALRLAGPGRAAGRKKYHLIPLGVMAAELLLTASAPAWAGPKAAGLFSAALEAGLLVLLMTGLLLAFDRRGRGDLPLYGHLLAALSAILAICWQQQQLAPTLEEAVALMLGGALLVYLPSLAMLALAGRLGRKGAAG